MGFDVHIGNMVCFVWMAWFDEVRASGGPLTHCHGVCCFETCVNARFIISFLVSLSLYNLSNLIHVLFHWLVVMQCTPRFRWVMVRNRILVWIPLSDGQESYLGLDSVEWWSGIPLTPQSRWVMVRDCIHISSLSLVWDGCKGVGFGWTGSP